MKRLVCVEAGKVDWQEIEEPALGHHDVRIRCRFGVEKHGTMAAFFKGYANRRGGWDAERRFHTSGGMLWNYPIGLGNMQCGDVVETGSQVSQIKVGERTFVSFPFQPVIVCQESQARVLKADLPWQTGMLLDPAEFACGAIRDGNVRLGDRVAVFGLGAIGLVVVQALKAAGAEVVVAIDPVEHRRAVAAQSGATSLDPIGTDVGLTLREICGGIGPDVVIDFSGSAHALQAALRGVAYGGTIVCGAFPPPHTVGLDFGGEAHMNRPRIVFSRACSDPNPDHPRWDAARIQRLTTELINRGDLDGTSIVDPPISFDNLKEVYPRIGDAPENSIKLSVCYD